MATLLVTPYWQLFDSNGDPLNGGKIYTYEAGTSTPKATYTEADGLTPHANPVILDSAGRAVLFGQGSYKFVITDSLDNIIETVDFVTVFATDVGNIVPSASGSGTVNAITADFNPDLQLVDKQLCIVTSIGPNTVINPTFSPDGNTARTIVKAGGLPLELGDTGNAGFPMFLQYDLANTRWELMNPVQRAVTFSSVSGYVPSSIAGNSTTASLTVSAGQASDSTNSAYISKSTTTSWAVSNGNAINGYSGGTTLPNSTPIHFFICEGTSGQGVFASDSLSPTLPTGYSTRKRRIFSLKTDSSGALPVGSVSYESAGGSLIIHNVGSTADVNGTVATGGSTFALATVPTGLRFEVGCRVWEPTSTTSSIAWFNGDEASTAPTSAGAAGGIGYDMGSNGSFAVGASNPILITDTSAQVKARSSVAVTGCLFVRFYRDFRRD